MVLAVSALAGMTRGVLSAVPLLVVSLFLYAIWKKAGLF
jgi:hypothetical protein